MFIDLGPSSFDSTIAKGDLVNAVCSSTNVFTPCAVNLLSLYYLRESEKASTPNLDRQYPPPMIDSLPRILATFTTLPWLFFSSSRNWRVTSISPVRFTSKTFVKSSNCIHSTGPMGMDLPALFTRPHRPAEGKRQNNYQLMSLLTRPTVHLN